MKKVFSLIPKFPAKTTVRTLSHVSTSVTQSKLLDKLYKIKDGNKAVIGNMQRLQDSSKTSIEEDIITDSGDRKLKLNVSEFHKGSVAHYIHNNQIHVYAEESVEEDPKIKKKYFKFDLNGGVEEEVDVENKKGFIRITIPAKKK